MKIHCNLLLCALGISFCLMPNSAQALAFRCDSFLIDVGMHKAEVLKKCGNPAMRDQKTERRRLGMRQSGSQQGTSTRHSHDHRSASEYELEVEVQIEEWVYNFGPQRFMQLLTFEDGRLKKIQDLEHGR